MESFMTTSNYVPRSTRVDSPIEEALTTREGVCQDFAHVMIALVRSLGIPLPLCQRVSASRQQDQDRSRMTRHTHGSRPFYRI